MKILLVAINCSYAHASLAIPYLQAAYRARLPSLPLPLKKEYLLRDEAETIASALAGEHPDLIGFSCYIFNISLVLKVVRLIRDFLPGATILFGGPEMAEGGTDFFAAPGGPDYAIRGEGEAGFVKLIGCLSGKTRDAPDEIPGLTWKHGETVVLNAAAAPIEPPDMIPSPFKAGLAEMEKRFVLLEASRGCPFRCDFCLSGSSARLREFPLERVFEDIDIVARRGVGEIRFVDRTFNAHAARAVSILKYIADNHPAMRVHVELEPSLLNSPKLLECLDRENIHAEIGLQDLNPAVLRKANRRSPAPADLAIVRRLCRESKAAIHLDLVAGLPGGTLSGLYDNADKLTSFAPREIQVEVLKVLRGTGLRESESLVYEEQPPYAVTETLEMTKSDIREARLLSRLVDMFYNDPHLGPIVKQAVGISAYQDGFWRRFCEWWQQQGFRSFGISKQDRFDLLLKFFKKSVRREDERKKLFCQWVFRRLCYAKLRPRRDLDGVKYVEGGKLTRESSGLVKKYLGALPSNECKSGSWRVWHFACDPQSLRTGAACEPARYLWIWDNPLKPAASRCYRLDTA